MTWARRLLGSLAVCAGLVCVAPRAAGAQDAPGPLRILVSAGGSRGMESEAPLKHAADDAAHVLGVFVAQGWVRREHALLVREPTLETLSATLERARAIAGSRRPEDVLFIFYYSGHGSATALHLGNGPLPLRDLAAKLAQVPAGFRLVVTDACRTADPMRLKGVTVEPAFSLSLKAPVEARGAVWLHATGDGEVAQESDELGGALFTHHWVQGLRGAADENGDSRVTLDESYAYAYAQTLARSARGSGGVYQRPARRLDIKEAAPVVLTHTQVPAAEIELPRGTDTHYLVYGYNTHSIAAELFAVPERSVIVAVPAGRYVVQVRRGQGDGAVELRLAQGEKRALAPADFKAFSREELVEKGGEILVTPHDVTVAYGFGAGGYAGQLHGGSIRYAYQLGAWSLGALAGVWLGGETTSSNDNTTRVLGLRARGARTVSLGATGELAVGAGLVGEAVFQTVRRLDADIVARAGYPSERSFEATALGGEAFAAARAWVGASCVVGLEVGFAVTGAKAGKTIGAYPRGEVAAFGGLRF